MTDAVRRTVPLWLGVLAVGLVAANLRPVATSVGPALPDVAPELAMNPTVAGLLTALPGLCFALVGATAAWLATRAGLSSALTLGALAIAGGLVGRAMAPSAPVFLLLSAVALGGAAIGNILVPAFVKRHFPHRVALLMTVYTVALSVGATSPGLLHPVLREVGGWRLSLGLWGWVALAAVLPWLWLATRERRHRGTAHHAPALSLSRVARSRKAIALALFFGSQSMQAYVGFGWIPSMLVDAGVSHTTASLSVAILSGWGFPLGLVTPWLATRFPDRRPIVLLCTALLVAGWAGVLVAPAAAPFLWVSLLGVSGLAFPLALYLVTDLTREVRVTSALSGFVQSTGYVVASIGPFLVGWLHSMSGGWSVPLWFLLVTAIPFGVAGWYAGKPGFVDDELPGSPVAGQSTRPSNRIVDR